MISLDKPFVLQAHMSVLLLNRKPLSHCLGPWKIYANV